MDSILVLATVTANVSMTILLSVQEMEYGDHPPQAMNTTVEAMAPTTDASRMVQDIITKTHARPIAVQQARAILKSLGLSSTIAINMDSLS